MRGNRIVLCLLVVAFAQSALAQEYQVRRNVRLYDDDWRRITTLHRGDPLWDAGYERYGRYVAVRTAEDQFGWVYAPFTSVLQPPEEEDPTVGVGASGSAGGNGILGIHFLDVGQGDSTLVVCPNGNRILVDSGSLPMPSATRTRTYRSELRALLDANAPVIHTLVITHPDGDHFGLLPQVLSGVRVDRVLLGGELRQYGNASWGGRQVHNGRRWLNTLGNRIQELAEDHHDAANAPSPLFDCGAADIHILAASIEEGRVRDQLPQPQRRLDSEMNTLSVVLRIDYNDFEAILTGDATFATEHEIIAWYPASFLDVEVLKIGHHGSSTTSTMPSWATATKPRAAIASAGRRNSYGHPRGSVIETLAAHTDNNDPAHSMTWREQDNGRRVWRTPDDYTESIYATNATGTIRVFSDGEDWWLEE